MDKPSCRIGLCYVSDLLRLVSWFIAIIVEEPIVTCMIPDDENYVIFLDACYSVEHK